MSEIKGVVKATSNKYGKYSILIDDIWYSSKFEIAADRGDEVVFEDEDKRYIRKLRVTAKGDGGGGGTSTGSGGTRTPGFPVGVDTKDRSIVRQNSLNHATSVVTALAAPTEYKTWEEREVAMEKYAVLAVSVARIFEDYSAGDSDAEEAKKMLDS